MTGRASATGKPRDDGAHVRAPHRATFVDAPDEPTTPDLLLEDGGPRPLPGPGERIRQYEVIRELGREGSSAVLAARDLELGRKVAIKLLLGDVDPVLTARFLLGAKATARCRHENVIAIHEVGEHGGNPFVVLEHLQGAPLTQLLQDGRKLPPARAVELMVPVVRALAVAHAHNLIHGDLKPDKIFVTDAGTIKVLDLGLARLVHGEPREA
ncbi:MAG TPA: serine/threonine-protein kinase, partial [Kofleriaceae bacterium]|nr:serine/threonine-protein kinase [Kofleriaceae bacterium]